MKNFNVKDLMVPISEYATVIQGATLFEAVLALEKAQEEYDPQHTPYHHRAILVLDEKKSVIGKLSQLDVLRALESRDESVNKLRDINQFHFSPKLVAALREQNRMTGSILEHVYERASSLKVEDFMQSPSIGEYVEEDTSLDAAIHQLVAGTHLSLLVTKGKDIVGILRMSDVFGAVFHAMKNDEPKKS